MEAYCLKCKSKREMKDESEVKLKNGKSAVKGKCSVCNATMFAIGKSISSNKGAEEILSPPVENAGEASPIDMANNVKVDKLDSTDFTTKINFRRVKCLIGPVVGNTLFVVHKRTVSVSDETFTIKGGGTYHIILENTAFIAKYLFGGAMPHLLYNIEYMYPINPYKRPDLSIKAKDFNTMFKRNIIMQGFAALKSTGLNANIAVIIIIAVITGVMGYFIGTAFPATSITGHVATSTTTFHSVNMNQTSTSTAHTLINMLHGGFLRLSGWLKSGWY